MSDTPNTTAEYAFSSKDLEAFLKRLRIPVNGTTKKLAFEIDFAMRRGDRASALVAARELAQIVRDAPPFDDGTGNRREYNPNALDPDGDVEALAEQAVTLYSNMAMTLQVADPEEGKGELYSPTMMGMILDQANLPNDPLVKEWVKRIAQASMRGGTAAADREADGLIGYLISEDLLPENADRAKLRRMIADSVIGAELYVDQGGDPDGNWDLQNPKDTPVGEDGPKTTVNMDAKFEEDKRRAEEAKRVNEDFHQRQNEAFNNLITREGGFASQLGLDVNVDEDADLLIRLKQLMHRFQVLGGRLTEKNIRAIQALEEEFKALAKEIATRQGGAGGDLEARAEQLAKEISDEVREVTRQREAQFADLAQQSRAAVEAQMRQEAEEAARGQTGGDAGQTAGAPPRQDPPAPGAQDANRMEDPAKSAPDEVQKVAAAFRSGGEGSAREVARVVAEHLRAQHNFAEPVRQIANELLVAARNFLEAEDRFAQQERAAHEPLTQRGPAPQDDTRAAAARDTTQPGTAEGAGRQNPAEQAQPEVRLSDYHQELQFISFLLAEGNDDEARASADTLAATLRAFGGKASGITGAMIMTHVMREDKRKQDAMEAAAGPRPEPEDDGSSDRAGWFLLTARRKDARSARIYDALVRALLQGDKKTVGKLAKALANHILALYKTKVTITEMLTAIVTSAKEDAKAGADTISELSMDGDDSDTDSNNGSDGGGSGAMGPEGDDDDLSDRASWFLMMAIEKDKTSEDLSGSILEALELGDKKTAGALIKDLATHILQMYKTNVTLKEMMVAITKAAKQELGSTRSVDSDVPAGPNRRDDREDGDGAAGMVAATGPSGISLDMSLVKRVDWGSFATLYSMDTEESDAVSEVAKLLVKKGKEAPVVLKSCKELLSRSSKKVKGAKVKNHKHLVAAIEDALIKKSESKKLVKPLKFADIPDPDAERDSVSV